MRDLLNHMPALVRGAVCAATLLGCAGLANAGEALPTSLRVELAPLNEIETFKAPEVDIAKELNKDAQHEGKSRPMRFAVPNETKLTPENSGVWEDAGNGLAVWRLVVSAEQARSINFGFTDYFLPEKATLWLYSANEKQIEGPYTNEHNSESMQLWTPVIGGEEVVVELTVPIELYEQVRLEIGRVNTAYRDFGLLREDGTVNGVPKSGSCNLDTICGAADGFPQVDLWRGQISSVGAYTISGIDTCTGSMVNNTAQDSRPLFLTADHCGVDNNPGGIVVYWNYESPTCRPVNSGASGTPIPRVGFPTTSGSTLLMTTPNPFSSTGPDVTLVELNSSPAPTVGVTFAGWDIRETVSVASAVTIHHPGVDEKRISFEDQQVNRSQGLNESVSGPTGTHWWIQDWDLGTTEGGSSGSPLYSPEMRVIGVLSGGTAACGNNDPDWYGRLAVAWDGASAASRLRDHLDPLGLGVETLDILGAGPIPFLTAGPLDDISASGAEGGPFVGGSDSTTISNMTEADATYTVTILPGGTAPIMLSGDTGGVLSDGDTATFTVSLDTVTAASLGIGLYTSTVEIEDLTNAQTYTRDLVLEVGRTCYDSTDVPVSIVDLTTVQSTLTIPDNVCVADLNVEIDITHSYQGDIVMDLTSPSGTVVRLRNGTGAEADNINETFDDEGTAPDGPGALSDFDNSSAQGTWTLTIFDDANQDQGTLNGWALKVQATGTDCAPVAADQGVNANDAELETITLVGFGDGALTYTIDSLPTDGALIDPAGPNVIASTPYALMGDQVFYVSTAGFGGGDGFEFVVNDNTALTSDPGTVSIGVNASDSVYSFTFDSVDGPGWTTEGQWEYGVPQGNDDDPTSGSTGSNVYGYNLNGNYTNDLPDTYLTTTSLDFTGITNAELCFERWLGVEQSSFDTATVEVSGNGGGSWTTIYVNPSGFGNSIQDTSWTTVTYDISTFVDGQPNVLVRWGHSTDGSVLFSGWNIDDVVFKGDGVVSDPLGGCCLSDGSCVVATAADCSTIMGDYLGDGTDCSMGCVTMTNDCFYDTNNDGLVDIIDFGAFGTAFGSMLGDPLFDAALDSNGDDVIDIIDFGLFGMEFGRADCLDAK